MGASSLTIDFKDMPVAELQKEVSAIRDEHIRDHGVSYSGAWGSKSPGVSVPTLPVFQGYAQAEDYILEHNDKWDCVMAVRYYSAKPNSATQKKEKELNAKLQEAQNLAGGWKAEEAILTRVRAQKSKTKGCPHCGSSIAVAYIRRVHCPVCGKDFLRTAQDLKKLEKAKEKVALIQAQIAQLATKTPGKDAEVRWLVGGWCPS